MADTHTSFIVKIRHFFLRLFRLNTFPVIKLYPGFGNKSQCYLYGHVLAVSPKLRNRHRNNFLLNTLALLRLFMVRPIAGAELRLTYNHKTYFAVSQDDGFFKFEWDVEVQLPGNFTALVSLLVKNTTNVITTAQTSINIPDAGQFIFISDIDDTFLVSHSGNLRKRLYVLLTKNAHSRKPFEGVVNHYNLLSMSGVDEGKSAHPFFYVSSSEWNLYDYIKEFSRQNKLPEGVYLLNQLKRISQVFKTGQNNHSTKFMRIVRILEAYPEQQFVLLGDDSQEDPNIYASVVSHFPGKIFSVYIRQVRNMPKIHVQERIKQMETAGVFCCYFKHSAEAVIHSRTIGLITHV
ncbi:MAG: DUF2183 domain-containing protein [Chitinophagaceae bacterium]|nr:DUF2183 domain-containing protein [Chitinophagaceae bacterium]